jgi:serine/threonine protein kinase/Flp pilus assembly protein TadD
MNQSPDWQLISSVVERWRGGEPADAQQVLRENPHLASSKSTFVELAYEEYLYRTAAGEEIDTSSFCERFPEYRYSIGRRLETHLLGSLLFELDLQTEEIAWPELGDEVCGFHLVEELGRGLAGRVFLAEELSLDRRKVVVKFTHAGVGEAETLSRLAHSNIVPVYSLQQDDLSGLAIICMPYLGRHTLQDVLDAAFAQHAAPPSMDKLLATFAPDRPASEPVSYVDWIVSLGAALCDALVHTHQRGILHLDLKPSNILLSADGRPLVLDFNLSQDSDARKRLLGGTMPYMSPEQIQKLILGDIGIDLDARTDVYSLGVILYQLLTGEHPFGAANLRQQKKQQVASDLIALQTAGPIPAHKQNPRVSVSLSRLLQRAMSPQAEQRPTTAAEFGALLRKELGGWKAVRRTLRRHWRRVLAGVAIAVGITAGITGYMVTRDPPAVRYRNRAIAAAERGDHHNVVGLLTNSLNFDPLDHEAFFLRGRSKQHLGDFEGAQQDFQRAHQLSPQGKYSACEGFSLAKINRHSEAIARYERGIQEGFETPEVWLSVARCQLALKSKVSAEQAMLKAVKLDPKHSLAWHNLAIFYLNAPEQVPQEARRCMEQSLNGSVIYPEQFVTLASAQFACDPQDLARVKEILRSGMKQGLNEQDCRVGTFFKAVSSDESLLRELREQGEHPRIMLNPEPLKNDTISQRARNINTVASAVNR